MLPMREFEGTDSTLPYAFDAPPVGRARHTLTVAANALGGRAARIGGPFAMAWAVLLVACGGSQQPGYPEGPPHKEEAPDEDWDTGNPHQAYESANEADDKPKKKRPAEEDSEQIPTKCSSKSGSTCVPAGKWVRRLCQDVHADVALFMFQSGTPWQRMYLTRETDAINASGGASVAGTLAFDEEVLVLRHREVGENSIQVGSGSGSYDALRWDGSCVSLEGEEVTTREPPKAKTSRIEWRWLGDDMQDALREDDTVDETFVARKRECKGATMGTVSKKCQQLDEKLIEVTAKFVRGTQSLPQPKNQP